MTPVRWRLLIGGEGPRAGRWVEVDGGRVVVEVRVGAAVPGGRCVGRVCCEVPVPGGGAVDLSLLLAPQSPAES